MMRGETAFFSTMELKYIFKSRKKEYESIRGLFGPEVLMPSYSMKYHHMYDPILRYHVLHQFCASLHQSLAFLIEKNFQIFSSD